MPKVRTPRVAQSDVSASCAWIARSHNLKHLWIMRMLVRQNAMEEFRTRYAGSLNELHFPSAKRLSEDEHWPATLAATLKAMEARASRFQLDKVLQANLDLLKRTFGFSRTGQRVLALAVLLTNDDLLHKVARSAESSKNPHRQIAGILGMPIAQVSKAVSPLGCLRKTGLIDVSNSGTPDSNLQLGRGRLRVLANKRLGSVDEIFSTVLRSAPDSTLNRDNYAHLRPGFDFVEYLLRESLQSRRVGVNILLHGSPGTGKTECARLLSRELEASLYEISFLDADGDPQCPRDRLQNAAKAQFLLRGRRALLLFDEVDAAFNDGSEWTGKPTTAESSKAWVNELLEQSPIPMIWTANRIDRMDPAFVRRFDLVIRMESPPLRQRERLLEKLCGDALDSSQIRRFAQIASATPAVVTRAVNVVRRVACADHSRAELLEAVLDGTLTAQGHASVQRSCRGLPAQDYDVSLCNADADLDAIASGLTQSGKGRICLYGPPGTGKTAFGHWLAKTLDRPLVLKRASDIQSMWLGEMEKNLARAFEEAARDRAVLQIDEVDSFLQDRRGAERPWEISQINEFLTQLESFDGVFVASTNLMDGLDPAALRRFDYKVRVDYLRSEQAWRLFERLLCDWNLAGDRSACREQLARMAQLTPGDFAVVRRRHAIVPFANAVTVLDALRQEAGLRKGESRRIGFV
ncbi:ATP-binding protein [Rudaea sp.]|uniref:AAA family ATPase n=1 Tax=Rudaea sp. TaxID=2136325 RepID=UPI0032204206